MKIRYQSPYILAFDLGTGGNKCVLVDARGVKVAEAFYPCKTYYPRSGWHEQRPEAWWDAVVESTRKVVAQSGIRPGEITSCSISGQSLGVVPIDRRGALLRELTPIWSDTRAAAQAGEFFHRSQSKYPRRFDRS